MFRGWGQRAIISPVFKIYQTWGTKDAVVHAAAKKPKISEGDMACCLLIIVKTQGANDDPIILYPVHTPVFFGYASGPQAR